METLFNWLGRIDYLSLIIAGLAGMQILILLKIRDVLKNIDTHISRVSAYYAASQNMMEELEEDFEEEELDVPEVCQFCKHKVAYIGSSKVSGNGEELFYRCALLNKEIRPTDSCPHFEFDEYLTE